MPHWVALCCTWKMFCAEWIPSIFMMQQQLQSCPEVCRMYSMYRMYIIKSMYSMCKDVKNIRDRQLPFSLGQLFMHEFPQLPFPLKARRLLCHHNCNWEHLFVASVKANNRNASKEQHDGSMHSIVCDGMDNDASSDSARSQGVVVHNGWAAECMEGRGEGERSDL